MATAPSWRELVPAPAEVRGLGTHDGALAALTGAGLFTMTGGAWSPLDATGLGASVLPCGRLVIGRVVTPTPTPTPAPGPPPRGGEVVELTALAIAPDGAVWTGERTRGLSFYAAPGSGGMDVMHPAYPVTERLARDGAVVRKRLAVRDLAFDARGRLWVATSDRVEVLEDGAWRVALARGASQVAMAADGTIVVVASATAGSCSADGVTFRNVSGRATEAGEWGSVTLDVAGVQQLERAPDGALWARMPAAVLVWTGDRWASRSVGLSVIPGHGTRALRTTSLAVTRDAVYVATSIGVFHRARA